MHVGILSKALTLCNRLFLLHPAWTSNILHKTFMPFQNESDVFEIARLTVENHLDRISVYGSLDITKDKEGLQRALMLKRLIDDAIDEMKRESDLPEKIVITEGESLKNPFL